MSTAEPRPTDLAEARRLRSTEFYSDPLVLPPHRYTSHEFHEAEVACVWGHTWQMVCRESEVREPGSFVEYEIGDESILVIRDERGGLAALSNVCRHRGTRLRRGAGRTSALRCPFHGWRYATDGTLEEITNDWDFAWVDRSAMCLPRFPVDTWGGFVFVNLDRDAPPLLEYLDPLPAEMERHHPEEWVCTLHISSVMPCNWKLAQEAFLEFYHATWTHPSTISCNNDVDTRYAVMGPHGRLCTPVEPSANLRAAIDDRSFAEAYGAIAVGDPDWLVPLVEAGLTARQAIAERRREFAQASGWDVSGHSDSDLVDGWQWNAFPNFVIGSSPFPFGFRFRPNGNDPGSCVVDSYLWRRLAAGEARTPDAVARSYPLGTSFEDMVPPELRAYAAIQGEDLRNLTGVQQNLRSMFFDGLALGLYQECRIRRLHEVIDEYVARHS